MKEIKEHSKGAGDTPGINKKMMTSSLRNLNKIFSDLVDAIANGRVALLCFLDLSAAFDTVDHQIPIRRLETSYQVGPSVPAGECRYSSRSSHCTVRDGLA